MGGTVKDSDPNGTVTIDTRTEINCVKLEPKRVAHELANAI